MRTEMTPARTPALVAWLAYGGLLPFVALAVADRANLLPEGLASGALIAYGAVILSFVGALHWAFAMTVPTLSPAQRRARYAWSVVPALLAWPAVLLPVGAGAPVLVAGFALQLWQDRLVVAAAGDALPAWYLTLRLRLSVVAALSLIAAASH